MQQSAAELHWLPVEEKSFRQLLFPQVKPLAHSESLSQSPPPVLQGDELEQQLQPVVGTPLQLGATVGPGVVVVGGAN